MKNLNLFIFTFLFFSSSSLWASTKIPVRLAIQTGFHGSSYSFEKDRKDKSIAGFGLGFDFNTELTKTVIIGTTGWIVPPISSQNRVLDSFLVASLYLGVKTKKYDFFAGPGVGTMSAELSKTKASPETKIQYSGTMGCGVVGSRYYFDTKIRTGFGANGYYCFASSYEKEVLNSSSTVPTTTDVNKSATSGGIFLFLFISWDEKRKLS